MAGEYNDLIQQAYAGIGRSGIGGNVNQIDPEGFNYWQGQLQSGALNPQNFQQAFTGAVQGALSQAGTANTPQYEYIQSYLANPDQAPVTQPETVVTTTPVDQTVSPIQSQVEQLYRNVLGREADPEGLKYWTGQWGSNISPDELSQWMSIAKPGQAYDPNQITALGDSTTWGYNSGSRVATGMTDTAQQLLAQDLGRDVRINNLGVNATTLGDAMASGNFNQALTDASSTVLLNYGMNEAYRKEDPRAFEQNLMSAVQQLRAAGKDVVLQTPNYTEAIPGVNDYADVIRSVAAKTGASLQDKWSETQSLYGQYDPNDLVHPTQSIYSYLGHSLADILKGKYRT